MPIPHPARSEPRIGEPEPANDGTDPAAAPSAPDPAAAPASAEAASPSPDAPPAQKPKSGRKRLLLIIVALLVIGAATYGVRHWLVTRDLESTDDAFIESNVVQISPKISGTVEKVYVNDNEEVQAGQLLVEIDPRDYRVKVDQAQAALDSALARQQAASTELALTRVTSSAGVDQAASGVDQARATQAQAEAQAVAAQAEASRAQADAGRYKNLYAKDEVSRQRLDQAVADARSAQAQADAARKGISAARAQVEQMRAKLNDANSAPQQVAAKQSQIDTSTAEVAQARTMLDQARLELSYTSLRAPVAGRITKKNVDQGQFTQTGQALMAMVYGEVWVVANFKETQLTRMRPGQPVDLKVDVYPEHILKGHVDSFQSGTGSRFSLLPPENATGNYVKVVQRLPVKIVLDEQPDTLHLLVPGMSVVPTVSVNATSAPINKTANAR